MYLRDTQSSVWKIGMSVRRLRSLRRSDTWVCEIIDAKTKFYLTASSNPRGCCKIDKLFLNSSGNTHVFRRSGVRMHGFSQSREEIRDNEPRKEWGEVIMIIMLDRYIVKIIDSEYSKLHLSMRITRDTRDLLQVERKHDMRGLYIHRHLNISCIYI